MATVRAKFYVSEKIDCADQSGLRHPTAKIVLRPVCGDTPENKQFWKWTPGGEITLHTINTDAADALELGKQFYVDFTPAE